VVQLMTIAIARSSTHNGGWHETEGWCISAVFTCPGYATELHFVQPGTQLLRLFLEKQEGLEVPGSGISSPFYIYGYISKDLSFSYPEHLSTA